MRGEDTVGGEESGRHPYHLHDQALSSAQQLFTPHHPLHPSIDRGMGHGVPELIKQPDLVQGFQGLGLAGHGSSSRSKRINEMQRRADAIAELRKRRTNARSDPNPHLPLDSPPLHRAFGAGGTHHRVAPDPTIPAFCPPANLMPHPHIPVAYIPYSPEIPIRPVFPPSVPALLPVHPYLSAHYCEQPVIDYRPVDAMPQGRCSYL